MRCSDYQREYKIISWINQLFVDKADTCTSVVIDTNFKIKPQYSVKTLNIFCVSFIKKILNQTQILRLQVQQNFLLKLQNIFLIVLSDVQNPKKMIDLEDFEDFGTFAEEYQTYFYFIGISVAALIFRSLLFLGIFQSMFNLIESIQFSYLQIIVIYLNSLILYQSSKLKNVNHNNRNNENFQLIITNYIISFKILILILLSFCMIMRSLQGPYQSDFSSFDRAFIVFVKIFVILHYSKWKLLENNQLLTTFFMTIFYFLLTYFTFNMISVVYIDSYRQIKLRSNQKIENTMSSLQYGVLWLLYWFPKSVQDKILNF